MPMEVVPREVLMQSPHSRAVFSGLLVVGCTVCAYLLWSGSSAPLPLQLAGYTGTLSVRKGDDSGALTLTVQTGIITGVA